MYAGDETLTDAQTAPELEDNDGDMSPLSVPCDECGAEEGEPCRPMCTAGL